MSPLRQPLVLALAAMLSSSASATTPAAPDGAPAAALQRPTAAGELVFTLDAVQRWFAEATRSATIGLRAAASETPLVLRDAARTGSPQVEWSDVSRYVERFLESASTAASSTSSRPDGQHASR